MARHPTGLLADGPEGARAPWISRQWSVSPRHAVDQGLPQGGLGGSAVLQAAASCSGFNPLWPYLGILNNVISEPVFAKCDLMDNGAFTGAEGLRSLAVLPPATSPKPFLRSGWPAEFLSPQPPPHNSYCPLPQAEHREDWGPAHTLHAASWVGA